MVPVEKQLGTADVVIIEGESLGDGTGNVCNWLAIICTDIYIL